MLVRTEDVRAILEECLGEEVTAKAELTPLCTDLLRGWVPGVEPPQALEKRLEDAIFNALYNLLGPTLTVKPAHHVPWRIPMSALPEVADRLLLPVFMGLGAYPGNYATLRRYGMEHASNAALYTLLHHFAAFQSEEESRLEERILREAGWLEERKAP